MILVKDGFTLKKYLNLHSSDIMAAIITVSHNKEKSETGTWKKVKRQTSGLNSLQKNEWT